MKILNFFRRKFYIEEFELLSNNFNIEDILNEFLCKLVITHEEDETIDIPGNYFETYNEINLISVIVQILYFDNSCFTLGR